MTITRLDSIELDRLGRVIQRIDESFDPSNLTEVKERVHEFLENLNDSKLAESFVNWFSEMLCEEFTKIYKSDA